MPKMPLRLSRNAVSVRQSLLELLDVAKLHPTAGLLQSLAHVVVSTVAQAPGVQGSTAGPLTVSILTSSRHILPKALARLTLRAQQHGEAPNSRLPSFP